MPLCDSNSKSESRKLPVSKAAYRRRSQRLQLRNHVLKSQLDRMQQQFLEVKKRLNATVRGLEIANAELALRSTIEQPTSNLAVLQERAMPGFQFNLTTIATAIELGKRVGFRAASDAMKIVFDMLGIEIKVPSHDAIEQWTLRLGVALSKDTFRK